MKNNELRNERLMPLRDMKDYQVAKDSLNLVGWNVLGADGDNLGVVDDLIVDTQALKVRYLSVAPERRFFNTDHDPYMLVPIGVAAFDKKRKNVFVSYIDSRSISNYPIYAGGPIPEDYEYSVRDSIQRAQHSTLHNTTDADYKQEFDENLKTTHSERRPITEDFYDNDAYNENRFYTSDQDTSRTTAYTTTDADRVDTTSELHDETKSKTVEDSIATIERLERLRERGSITEEEFILMKKRALKL
ncbi:PRC-barrel domain-containing protein [Pontibacter roseus]|uniref:PRC-barrel domain-containing protein n=1 Tax=Pontibacter roseus TaxID=336989 RepID=UPI00037EDF96|nr:PRC-barrel domain-containing protein [Pontibacter roseus]